MTILARGFDIADHTVIEKTIGPFRNVPVELVTFRPTSMPLR
ncbi:hypothetical protein [Singulisphaera sp. GP187]|nr:hypothetical protein [Singulisphaera sp. GP187]